MNNQNKTEIREEMDIASLLHDGRNSHAFGDLNTVCAQIKAEKMKKEAPMRKSSSPIVKPQ